MLGALPNATANATAADYEQLIKMIPGVLAARVVMTGDEVTEVHVLGDTAHHPMQLVRDTESCIMAKFGVRIDHRRISVAQVDPNPAPTPRLVLYSINLTLAGSEAEVKATIHLREQVVTGVARGQATSRNRLVLAAQAVLNAVQELLPSGTHVALEALDTVTLGGERAILALVSLIVDQQAECLSGAAFVGRDETEGAGRAALAAINRRLGVLLRA